jgi:hypothetical protein
VDISIMPKLKSGTSLDFNDQLDDHPAARGLQLISRGFPMMTSNDNETAERAAFVYDALYASVKQGRTNP